MKTATSPIGLQYIHTEWWFQHIRTKCQYRVTVLQRIPIRVAGAFWYTRHLSHVIITYKLVAD